MRLSFLILSTAALTLAGPIIPTMVPDSETSAIFTSTDKPLPTMNVNEGSWPPTLPLCVKGEPPSKYPRGCCEQYVGELCVQERFNPPDEDPTHEPRPTPTEEFFQGPWPLISCLNRFPPIHHEDHDDPCWRWWQRTRPYEVFENQPKETETAGVR